MRVAFDLTAERLSGAGVGTYSRELRRALAERGDVALLEIAHAPTGAASTPGRIVAGLRREGVWYPRGLARTARAKEADLIHVPASLPAHGNGLPLVLTVHDAIPWRHPEWFTRANALQQGLLMRPALRRATRIITVSASAKADIVDLLGLDPARIDVVHSGISDAFSPSLRDRDWLGARFGVSGPLVLCVGTPEPRKNLAGAIAAFTRLARDLPEARLAIVGADGWRHAAIDRAIDDAGPTVLRTGRLGLEDLTRLYASADCLLFPSLMEGFGFPPLEAMASGLPVVCSDRPSLPEIAGDAAILVDPADPAGLAEAVRHVLTDGAHAGGLRDRGLAHAAAFTWPRAAEATAATYLRALA